MVDPAKVLGFLDFAGNWDPTLAFVMGGALLVTVPLFLPTLKRRAKPFFAETFALPTKTALDGRIVAGSAIFGVGWGLVGYCPGPAISSLAYLRDETFIFLAAMVAGALLFNLIPSPASPAKTAEA
jgi:uncharacterized membrane protein YedE/YeeE